jgi:hypothetical protein
MVSVTSGTVLVLTGPLFDEGETVGLVMTYDELGVVLA